MANKNNSKDVYPNGNVSWGDPNWSSTQSAIHPSMSGLLHNRTNEKLFPPQPQMNDFWWNPNSAQFPGMVAPPWMPMQPQPPAPTSAAQGFHRSMHDINMAVNGWNIQPPQQNPNFLQAQQMRNASRSPSSQKSSQKSKSKKKGKARNKSGSSQSRNASRNSSRKRGK